MKPELTFRQWMKKQDKRDDPVGDLARDMADDKAMQGVRLNSAKAFVSYLIAEHNPSESCIEAAKRAWREYEETA